MMVESTSHKRTRNKPILSCIFCRGRKLRCDRQSPCGACLRHGKPEDCTYSASEQVRKNAIDYRPHARNQQARQRVARLETLVTEMMKGMDQSSHQASNHVVSSSKALENPVPSLAPLNGHVIDNMGKLSLTDNHAVYMGSSHWVTILEDIRGLKDELFDEFSEGTISRESTPFDAGLMNGLPVPRISLLASATCLPREQILAMLPPRKAIDRHVSHFFNSFGMGPFLLQRNKFLAEYANFWVNPSAVPIMWVGLLGSVMAMSAFLQQQDAGALGWSPADSQDVLETYRQITINCLIAGDYLRPSRYTIETLSLHFAVDQNANVDTYIGNWILIGVVIRIAMRIGLHRDPSHWPNIRPLEAELRRRLWTTLYHMDFFTSTQVGLPRIIKDSQCDTRLPAHFFEHDLGFEHDQLPPERPLTDQSPLSFIIQRDAIIKVSAEIYDATEVVPPSSATIAALSAKLGRVIDAIPEWLRYQSLETLVADQPAGIMHRMFLDILIHKATYLLHRRSFVDGFVGEESTQSIQICIKAALTILEHQRTVDEETQAGGLLFNIRWKLASTLNHEFLQATMMLCFALSKSSDRHDGTTNSRALHRQSDILESLTIAKTLWEKTADQSMEARRAAKAITIVLQQDTENSTAASLAASDGMFEQVPGVSAESYFGSLDYGQNMALDPSFFAVGSDMAGFGHMLDDFMTENVFENQAGGTEAVPAALNSSQSDASF